MVRVLARAWIGVGLTRRTSRADATAERQRLGADAQGCEDGAKRQRGRNMQRRL